MWCSCMSYTAWGSLNLPTCWMWYIRSPPFTYSMTKYRRSCHSGQRKRERIPTLRGFKQKLKSSSEASTLRDIPRDGSAAARRTTLNACCHNADARLWQGDLKSPQQSASRRKENTQCRHLSGRIVCAEVCRSLMGPDRFSLTRALLRSQGFTSTGSKADLPTGLCSNPNQSRVDLKLSLQHVKRFIVCLMLRSLFTTDNRGKSRTNPRAKPARDSFL